MKNKQDITVILPINKIKETELPLLQTAINSVFAQKDNFSPTELLIITNEDTKKLFSEIKLEEKSLLKLKNYQDVDIKFLINPNNVDNYQNQINTAVKEIKTKFFTILDFDDEFTNLHFKMAERYIRNMPEVDLFLTIIADTTMQREQFRYCNEINWVKEVTNDKHGSMLMEVVLNYNLIALNGAIISKEKFEEIGGLKESMKLSYVKEFLLRFINNDGISYTIPKIGYVRKNGRDDSYLDRLNKEMDEDEANFWFNLASREYVFPHDRNKTYVPKKETTFV